MARLAKPAPRQAREARAEGRRAGQPTGQLAKTCRQAFNQWQRAGIWHACMHVIGRVLVPSRSGINLNAALPPIAFAACRTVAPPFLTVAVPPIMHRISSLDCAHDTVCLSAADSQLAPGAPYSTWKLHIAQRSQQRQQHTRMRHDGSSTCRAAAPSQCQLSQDTPVFTNVSEFWQESFQHLNPSGAARIGKSGTKNRGSAGGQQTAPQHQQKQII